MAKQNEPNKNNRYNDNYYNYQRPKNKGVQRGFSGDFDDIYSNSPGRAERGDSGAVPLGGRRQRRKKHSAVSVILIIVLLAVASTVIFIMQLMAKVNTNSIDRDPYSLGINAGVEFDRRITNIALFGLDDRENTFQGRSDVVMVLSVDQQHGKLKMTSILRDSLVYIDGYGEDKLNHAYAYGGPELAVKTLNQNFNLDISDYVTVNFNNMAGIVDACGGTELNITEAEMNEINANLYMLVAEEAQIEVKDTDYIYEYGDVTLNGMQAVAFARIRSLDGDAQRAERQQKVLSGMMDRVKSMSIFGYANLANKIMPMCETSIGVPTVLGFVPLLIKNFGIESLSIPGWQENPYDGYTDAGSWVYVYDREYASQHIDAFIKEEESLYYYEFYGM